MEHRCLSDFECSVSEIKHLTFNAVPLSCDHYACFSCLPPSHYDTDPVICLKCGKENEANMHKRLRFSNLDHQVNFNLDFLFAEIAKEIQTEKEKYKELAVDEFRENIKNKCIYFRDEVDIRVESLKSALDNCRDELMATIDSIEKQTDEVFKTAQQIDERFNVSYEKKTQENLNSQYEQLKELKKLNESSAQMLKDFELEIKIPEFEIEAMSVAQLYHAASDESNSVILSNQEIKQLEKLVNLKIRKQKLLYRASDDGFSAKSFHKKCDGHPNTLTLIKSCKRRDSSNDSFDFVFGGFTTQTWDGNAHKKDNDAFIFSFKNLNDRPEKMPIKESYAKQAILCSPKHGPAFGTAFNIKFGFDWLHRNYAGLIRHSFVSSEAKSRKFLAGDGYFDLHEMEVFQIVFLN